MWFAILLFLIVVFLIIFIFFLCRKIKSLNTQYEQQKYKLDSARQEIIEINFDYSNKTKACQQLEKQYEERKRYSEDQKKTLELLYSEKKKWLEQKYQKSEKELNDTFQESFEKLEEEKQQILNELDSLRKTKSAAIQAFQKEQEIKEQKDLYRLNIGENELNDIKILRSIQYKLSNQRILSMLIWQTYFYPVAKEKFKFIIGEKDKCGIYKITNTINQKVYIGQAKNIKKRLTDHMKCGLGIDTPANNKLYDAIKNDGLENFTFEILEECDKENLNQKETYYIEMYNAVSWGYNSQNGNKK